MTITRGDYVRPNNPSLDLPRDSVWRVVCSAGALKLEPENGAAQRVSRGATFGWRFPERDFEKVVWYSGKWVAVNDDFLRGAFGFGVDPFSAFDMRIAERSPRYNPNFQNLPKAQTSAVATAEARLTSAASATAAIDSLLEAARKLEAERQQELREAQAAKAKADKEAAARAKVEEAKRQLAARLHADRCLGEATLALIAEVSRLNNGGAERPADSGIAAHVEQLQPLARSYGYRIVKPSMIALVVKL